MSTSRGQNRKYVLVDTGVILDYYLAELSSSTKTSEIIANIITSIKTKLSDIQILMPNFSMVNTYTELARWRWGKREKILAKDAKPISQRRYQKARNSFEADINIEKIIQPNQVSWNHVRAAEIISVIDHYYQYFRKRENRKLIRYGPLKLEDTLIGGMGISLVKLYGRENVAVVTKDDRVAAILRKAQRVSATALRKLKLPELAASVGLEYGPDIFPQVLHLERISNSRLKRFFGTFPLPVRQTEIEF